MRLTRTTLARLAVPAAAFVAVGVASAPASAATSSDGAQAVQVASQQAGDPYVYGADGPSSFDCSGLVQYAYGQAGVSVPRTTGELRAASESVSSPRVGDLVFNSPSHVGLYAGDGKMWAAPHSGDVVKLQDVYNSNADYRRL